MANRPLRFFVFCGILLGRFGWFALLLLFFFSGFMVLHFSMQNWLVPIYKLKVNFVALELLIHDEPQKGVAFLIQTKILF